jgi:hypothetical protein
MAYNPLQEALYGGQPLRQRRNGRYQEYYQDQEDRQGLPAQPTSTTAALVPPGQRPQSGYSQWAQNERALQPPQGPQGGPQGGQGGGQPRWNQGGGAINQLYNPQGGGPQGPSYTSPPPDYTRAMPRASSPAGLQGVTGASRNPLQQAQQMGWQPPAGTNMAGLDDKYRQKLNVNASEWMRQNQPQPGGPQPNPAEAPLQGVPSIRPGPNGQPFLFEAGQRPRPLRPEEVPQAERYIASLSGQGQSAAGAAGADAGAGGTAQWRGFKNAGGEWGGGSYNPNAIELGGFTGQLEGFDQSKLDPNHADANTIKYVFAKAASGVDVKSPGATQQVVDRLKAMGINASVENPDGEADRIIFHDTGETIDVMRGGANVGQDGWQWIDSNYEAGGQGAPMGGGMGQPALGGQDSLDPGMLGGDIGSSDYVMNALRQLQQTNPQLYQSILASIGG